MATALAMGDGDGDNISLNSITLRVSPSSVCRQQLGATTMRQPILLVVVVVVESLAFKIPHLMCLELHAAPPFPLPISVLVRLPLSALSPSSSSSLPGDWQFSLGLPVNSTWFIALPCHSKWAPSPLCLRHRSWRGRAWRGMARSRHGV